MGRVLRGEIRGLRARASAGLAACAVIAVIAAVAWTRWDRSPAPPSARPAHAAHDAAAERHAGRGDRERTAALASPVTSAALARLPDDDQAWVRAQATAAVERHQIDPAQLSDYVDQLAGVRQFAVDEREAPYPAPRADDEPSEHAP